LLKLANSFISEISIAPLAGWLVRVIMNPTPQFPGGIMLRFQLHIA
jgi:hypothetical protein